MIRVKVCMCLCAWWWWHCCLPQPCYCYSQSLACESVLTHTYIFILSSIFRLNYTKIRITNVIHGLWLGLRFFRIYFRLFVQCFNWNGADVCDNLQLEPFFNTCLYQSRGWFQIWCVFWFCFLLGQKIWNAEHRERKMMVWFWTMEEWKEDAIVCSNARLVVITSSVWILNMRAMRDMRISCITQFWIRYVCWQTTLTMR